MGNQEVAAMNAGCLAHGHHSDSMANRAHRGSILLATFVLLLLLALGAYSRFLFGFENDELQNLQFAWNIGQGRVPYLDFFEHHPPLYHYLMAAMVARLDHTSYSLLAVMRILSLLPVMLIGWGLWRVARRMIPPMLAPWVAVAAFLLCPFPGKLFESRADWLALACIAHAIVFLQKAICRGHPNWRAIVGGCLCGIGCCLTQKSWFLTAAIFSWAVATTFYSPSRSLLKSRAQCLLGFACGLLLPLLAGLSRSAESFTVLYPIGRSPV